MKALKTRFIREMREGEKGALGIKGSGFAPYGWGELLGQGGCGRLLHVALPHAVEPATHTALPLPGAWGHADGGSTCNEKKVGFGSIWDGKRILSLPIKHNV